MARKKKTEEKERKVFGLSAEVVEQQITETLEKNYMAPFSIIALNKS